MKNFSQFSLFQSHLDLAHHYWKEIVKPGDIVVDATCGNGYDTLILAQLLLDDEKGLLIAMDKQPEAIEAAKNRLGVQISGITFPRIRYETRCHSVFPNYLDKESVALAVYNLGYLPGGNKTMTTMCASTHQSLEAALPLIRHGGAVSITCYPGHPEGKREEEMIIEFSSNLDPRIWSCCLHKWCNRKLSPSLLICQKAEK